MLLVARHERESLVLTEGRRAASRGYGWSGSQLGEDLELGKWVGLRHVVKPKTIFFMVILFSFLLSASSFTWLKEVVCIRI